MKHYIIVKWNELVLNKEEFYEYAYEAFKDVTKIEGVNGLNVFKSNSDRGNRYDVMIEIDCTLDGLSNYDKSELHKRWKDNYSKYILSKAIFDRD